MTTMLCSTATIRGSMLSAASSALMVTGPAISYGSPVKRMVKVYSSYHCSRGPTSLTARGAPPPLALARRLRASLGPQALAFQRHTSDNEHRHRGTDLVG